MQHHLAKVPSTCASRPRSTSCAVPAFEPSACSTFRAKTCIFNMAHNTTPLQLLDFFIKRCSFLCCPVSFLLQASQRVSKSASRDTFQAGKTSHCLGPDSRVFRCLLVNGFCNLRAAGEKEPLVFSSPALQVYNACLLPLFFQVLRVLQKPRHAQGPRPLGPTWPG